ncbi:MAG TPA: glycosyltransferase family 4 protein [Candidatus Deferrimicrobium sp.]|nr:glycosyltransferase family 4 protein [Candidatus Deferrimicrobium sp.]
METIADKSDVVKLLGIDSEDPYGMRTFSGSSYHMWSTLRGTGALVDVFTPAPPATVVTFFKLRSFRPGLQKWKANWHRSVAYRRFLSARANRRISTLDGQSFNATLQVGAYYDISEAWNGYKALVADNNCVISQATNINFQSSERAFRRQEAFERAVYRSIDNIFCFSTYLANSFVRDFGCAPEKVVVVHAGINLDETSISGENKDYSSKTVLFSAFDFENKGGYLLLEAFDRVAARFPDARLLMLGPKPRRFPSYVTNLGPLSKSDPAQLAQIAQAYRRASVFVLPTLADAFPNVIREAMAARLPCVATNICGIPDMVLDGQTGFLTPLGDAVALAERLTVLLENPDLCRQMGEAAYARYKEHFTWKRVCHRMLATIGAGLRR